ncbi:hypothetical protein VKT23_019740 [Stygiomarasmius scandens]|uniref:Uncharacterized protein n=1 Tax=Marasmiellus scandens TaxID=2682957 RepID=A0ABR1IMZ1_9AGAR
MPASLNKRVTVSRRVPPSSPAQQLPPSPVDWEPCPVQSGYLQYCMKPSRLSRSLKIRSPESTVKCLLLLQMFPGLNGLLLCPKTSKPHKVTLSDSDTMAFKCSRCKVAQVDTRLATEHRVALQQNYDRYIAEKEKAARDKQLLEDIDEFIADIQAFLSEVGGSEKALQA